MALLITGPAFAHGGGLDGPGCYHDRKAGGTIAVEGPWQNAYIERLIGSIRRECLDHVIVLNERHLRQLLSSSLAYYHQSRTHLSLGKDCPERRPVQPPSQGKIIAFPEVGGLHHRYERRAA